MREGPLAKKSKDGRGKDEGKADVSTGTGYRGLFKSVPFHLVMLGNIPTVMAVYITYTYIPAMAEASGVAPSDASFIISVVGVTNTLGR